MSTTSQQPTYIIPSPASPNWKMPVLVGILIALIGSNIYLFVQLDRVRTESRNDLSKLTADFNGAIEKIRIDSDDKIQRSRRSVEELQARLAAQRAAADRAVGQAKVEAEKKVESLETKVAQEQAAEQQAITQVKQTADTATTQLASVSSDVGNVKSDLGNTKTQLEQTIANLKRATGELDNHSSLIATNASELKALRELGERNYSEFTVHKTKQPTRVADVMIKLKKADPKHNRFTLEITADDKTVEKKDRTINEPIQFYTSKAHQPDEIVVNSVGKDTVAGYLATPKVQNGRVGT
jgi:chromosome segregation ATPase